MKHLRYIIAAILLGLAIAGASAADAPKQTRRSSSASSGSVHSFLKKHLGVYPFECGMLTTPVFKRRFVKLLGQSKYEYLKRNFEVQSPIEFDNSHFKTFGMQAHSGGDPGFTIVYNPETDNLSVIWHENGRTKIYQEKPEEVRQYAS